MIDTLPEVIPINSVVRCVAQSGVEEKLENGRNYIVVAVENPYPSGSMGRLLSLMNEEGSIMGDFWAYRFEMVANG